MLAIKVNITSFISDDNPGFVECRFSDAWGKEHIVHEKVPVVTTEELDADSRYPANGVVGCEIVKEWTDTDGRTIFTVTTEKPWDIETVEGVAVFDILSDQIIERSRQF